MTPCLSDGRIMLFLIDTDSAMCGPNADVISLRKPKGSEAPLEYKRNTSFTKTIEIFQRLNISLVTHEHCNIRGSPRSCSRFTKSSQIKFLDGFLGLFIDLGSMQFSFKKTQSSHNLDLGR